MKLVGLPYRFGGRGYGAIDCSSLIVRAARDVLRMRVSDLPWMTAHQIANGWLNFTVPIPAIPTPSVCMLALFDWDEDAIFEHAAVKLLDQSWIWSSSSVGRVIHINPKSEKILVRQWREIEGALDGRRSVYRMVNWRAFC